MPRSPRPFVMVVVAAAVLSVDDFFTAEIQEVNVALPVDEASLASSAVSVLTYFLIAAACCAAESVCSGASVVIADESTCLMMVQSAAGIAATEEVTAPEVEAVAGADVLTAGAELVAAGAEVLDELELLQAASKTQAPPATITGSARRSRRDRIVFASAGLGSPYCGARYGEVTPNTAVSYQPSSSSCATSF